MVLNPNFRVGISSNSRLIFQSHRVGFACLDLFSFIILNSSKIQLYNYIKCGTQLKKGIFAYYWPSDDKIYF